MAKSFDALVRRTTTKATRNKAAARTRELLEELLLAEVRKATGRTQKQLANELGMKQPSLSKLEKQADMQISTLRRLVEALGGTLEVIAQFPQGPVRLRQFDAGRRT
jgi:DNA-binding XRE family transcriptional regulator